MVLLIIIFILFLSISVNSLSLCFQPAVKLQITLPPTLFVIRVIRVRGLSGCLWALVRSLSPSLGHSATAPLPPATSCSHSATCLSVSLAWALRELA